MVPPVIKGFKPYGASDAEKKDPVILLFEEYESLKLCDYEMKNHNQASLIMQVSRPTFTRIYAQARIKIAKALTEGRQIVIEGGKVYFDSDWYKCNSCGCYFNHTNKPALVEECPLCGSENVKEVDSDEAGRRIGNKDDICICNKCGYELEHKLGKPCASEICPNCNSRMKRKSANKL